MSSQLPRDEQLGRVTAITAYAASERLPYEYLKEQTAEFSQIGAREKIDIYRRAAGIGPVMGLREEL
jgi:hypothetical protein